MKNLVSSLEEIPLFGLERNTRQGEAIHNFFTYFSIGHLFMLLNSNIKRFEFFCHCISTRHTLKTLPFL